VAFSRSSFDELATFVCDGQLQHISFWHAWPNCLPTIEKIRSRNRKTLKTFILCHQTRFGTMSFALNDDTT
jgi:hypothetical protein